MNFNVQWLGVSFGKLLVGSGSVFYIFSLTGEGRPQSKFLLILMFSLFQLSDFRMTLKNGFGKCSLFLLSANGSSSETQGQSVV